MSIIINDKVINMSKCLKMHIVHSGFTGRDITNFLRIKKIRKNRPGKYQAVKHGSLFLTDQ